MISMPIPMAAVWANQSHGTWAKKSWIDVRKPSTEDRKTCPPRIPANRAREAPLGADRREWESRRNSVCSTAPGTNTARADSERVSLRFHHNAAATGTSSIPDAPSSTENVKSDSSKQRPALPGGTRDSISKKQASARCHWMLVVLAWVSNEFGAQRYSKPPNRRVLKGMAAKRFDKKTFTGRIWNVRAQRFMNNGTSLKGTSCMARPISR